MALLIKDIVSSDNIETMIEKINYNFDQMQIQGGGPAGPIGGIGSQGLFGPPGSNGVYWHVTNDLNAYILSPTHAISDQDIFLVTDSTTYNAVTYNKGDILRVTIILLLPAFTLIGNIKPDTIIQAGTVPILDKWIDTSISLTNILYYRNTADQNHIPLLFSSADTTVGPGNHVLDALKTWLNAGNNDSSVWIYGNSSTNGTGKLSFLYGNGISTISFDEIANAPFIQATISSDKFSLLLNSYNSIKNIFSTNVSNDGYYSLTNGVIEYYKIDQSKNQIFVLDTGKTLSVKDNTTASSVVITPNKQLGIGITPTEALHIYNGGNIKFAGSSSINVGNNTNVINFDSATGNIGIHGPAPTGLSSGIQFNRYGDTIKFIAPQASIIGPDTPSTIPGGWGSPPFDFVISSGKGYSNIGGSTGVDGNNLIIYAGSSSFNSTGPVTNGGSVFINPGGTGSTGHYGVVAIGANISSARPPGNVGIGIIPAYDSSYGITFGTRPINFRNVLSVFADGSGTLISTQFNAHDYQFDTHQMLGSFHGHSPSMKLTSHPALTGSNLKYNEISGTTRILGGSIINTPPDLTIVPNIFEVWDDNPELQINSGGGTTNTLSFNWVSGSTVNNMFSIIASQPSSPGVALVPANGYQLSINTDSQFIVNNAGSSTNTPATAIMKMVSSYANGHNNTAWISFYDTANVNRGSIVSSGSGVTMSYLSDRRLKENIIDANSSLDIFRKLQPREFDWKSNGKHELGFIAQELKEILPDLVIDNSQGNENLAEGDINYQYNQITPSGFIPYLVNATKELIKENDKLKLENQKLEDRIKKIEQMLNIQ